MLTPRAVLPVSPQVLSRTEIPAGCFAQAAGVTKLLPQTVELSWGGAPVTPAAVRRPLYQGALYRGALYRGAPYQGPLISELWGQGSPQRIIQWHQLVELLSHGLLLIP